MSSTIASWQTVTSVAFNPTANQWVQLRDPLSEYSANQALLLCEAGPDQWVAWVPNFGQVTLGREQMVMEIG